MTNFDNVLGSMIPGGPPSRSTVSISFHLYSSSMPPVLWRPSARSYCSTMV